MYVCICGLSLHSLVDRVNEDEGKKSAKCGIKRYVYTVRCAYKTNKRQLKNVTVLKPKQEKKMYHFVCVQHIH